MLMPFHFIFQKDQEALKDLFRKMYFELIYPVLHSASIPPYRLGDRIVEEVGKTCFFNLGCLIIILKGGGGCKFCLLLHPLFRRTPPLWTHLTPPGSTIGL